MSNFAHLAIFLFDYNYCCFQLYFFLFLVFIPIVVIALEILIWFLIVQIYFLCNFECSNKYIHCNHILVCYKYLYIFYLFGELCHKHWDILPGKVTAQNGYLQSIKMFLESEPFAVNLSSLKLIHSSNIGDVWIRIVAVKGKKEYHDLILRSSKPLQKIYHTAMKRWPAYFFIGLSVKIH